ncbi:MAG: DUF177 domain-containing protein [Solirubrobacteraceae bacterium]|nr:DUF177 domain-containing protein [Solirubrobacteraceae bacterium]
MEPAPGRFELGALHLAAGEGTRAEVTVHVDPISIGTETYAVGDVPVKLDVARMVGGGYSLRLRGGAVVRGTCLRCLDVIDFDRTLDVREIDRPGGDDDIAEEDDDLLSPYVDGDILALGDWVRDALVLDLPATMAPPTDDDDRCVQCHRTLQDLGAPAVGEPTEELDPRWAKLRELDLGDA